MRGPGRGLGAGVLGLDQERGAVGAQRVRLPGVGDRELARLTAPGGTLLAIAAVYDGTGEPQSGPPWPLSRAEVDEFATDGRTPVAVEITTIPGEPTSADEMAAGSFYDPGRDGPACGQGLFVAEEFAEES